ncbi:putative Monocarboxylate transporter [Magnetospirillum sp. LM-5]|uniref:MFS transporter n=1 Tax=Magnetospirillum sp. LM-5 TaxID=2681466 RepID=UPI0013847308|nr:MFS transporter [Magnetospirillum sp. LM-5]CAA7612891.1 putative Monocarboxylate transporter [Magnetospirillum sp. LM-5]
MTIPPYVPVLLAMTAAQSLVSLAMLSPAAMAPEIARDLGLAASRIGWWVSLAYGCAMLTSLMGGDAVRRLGAARATQVALSLVAGGAVCTALGHIALVLAGAGLIGLGYGMTNPAASHLLARTTDPAHRNLVFSIKQTGVPLGGTLAGLIAPPVALAFGWPATMILIGLLCAGLVALLGLGRTAWDGDRDPKAGLTSRPLDGLGLIWRTPRLRLLSLTGFAYAAVQLSVSTFMVTMLVTDLHWSLVQAGMLLSALQVAGVVGRISLGTLADRVFGGIPTLIGLGAATAVLAIITGFASPDWPTALVYGLLVPFGAAALGWNGIYLAELAHSAPPSQIPRVTGASLFFTYGGVLFGPPVFAALHGWLGSYLLTYAVSAVPALIGTGLLLAMRR